MDALTQKLGDFLASHPDPARAQIALVLGVLALLVILVRGASWIKTLVPQGTSRKEAQEGAVPMLVNLLKLSLAIFVVLYAIRVLVFY